MAKPEKTKITISVDQDVIDAFKTECDKHGMKVSARINVLIKRSLETQNKPE